MAPSARGNSWNIYIFIYIWCLMLEYIDFAIMTTDAFFHSNRSIVLQIGRQARGQMDTVGFLKLAVIIIR